MTAPPLILLVPEPGCLPGSEPATCPRTLPAGRKFTPASTSETGRKSWAGPETPPLTLFLPVGPSNLTVSDHELSAFASCMGDTVRRACTAPATQEASGLGDEKAAARGATTADASPTHAKHPWMNYLNSRETYRSSDPVVPLLSLAVACTSSPLPERMRAPQQASSGTSFGRNSDTAVDRSVSQAAPISDIALKKTPKDPTVPAGEDADI